MKKIKIGDNVYDASEVDKCLLELDSYVESRILVETDYLNQCFSVFVDYKRSLVMTSGKTIFEAIVDLISANEDYFTLSRVRLV